ncbi:hypothetical protein [Acinetobacter lwoffii]|uniref:hypothetical protein n=1 Tax=Acinetobacter lwoffii TaxID=28090 RepID=UPI003F90DA3E
MLIDKVFQCRQLRATLLITGVTTKNGTPISCEVRSYNRETGELVNQTTSNQESGYAILGGRQAGNYIIALDPDSEFNLATQDNVK